MLEVYLDPCTVNSRKVLAGLDLLDVKYDYHFIDYFKSGQKDPEFAKINPHCTVPAARDGDLVITESNAILQYAADLNGSPAYPKDLKQRANVNRWLLWEASAWFPSCYIYLVEHVVKPLMVAEADQSVIDAQAPRFNQLAKILDDQLSKTKFIAGNEVTIADLAIASCMHLHAAQRLPIDEYTNLKKWITEYIEPLPCWKNTQKAVDKALIPDMASYDYENTKGTPSNTGRKDSPLTTSQ